MYMCIKQEFCKRYETAKTAILSYTVPTSRAHAFLIVGLQQDGTDFQKQDGNFHQCTCISKHSTTLLQTQSIIRSIQLCFVN